MKRSRSRSPPPWQNNSKSPRREDAFGGQPQNQSFTRELARRNQVKENEQMKQWVSQEDDFVLVQSKQKAKIRVREGRAKPVDLLAVCLGVVDPSNNILEEESAQPDFEILEPWTVVSSIRQDELASLEKDIDNYLALESSKDNRTFWVAAKVLCKDRLGASDITSTSGRGVKSVSADIDKVLQPKSFDQLLQLEKQVDQKLNSDEPIDEDYWEQLLVRIGVFKAKAQLSRIYTSIMTKLARIALSEHVSEADLLKIKYTSSKPGGSDSSFESLVQQTFDPNASGHFQVARDATITDEADFITEINADRRQVYQTPALQNQKHLTGYAETPSLKKDSGEMGKQLLVSHRPTEDSSQVTKALYDREVARGVQEDEEVFEEEETISSSSKPKWSANYRPRKPRYFNRVQMGYEWNKYNQTHYDHDNPPPKVVQGYKFNIFYPELIDKTKAPTYRIERELGRKRGQAFAPAGEEDTCIIRFISGPPYEDIAFRIVDKEWDYSARRERGFRSSFDKGILQLHFHFKKEVKGSSAAPATLFTNRSLRARRAGVMQDWNRNTSVPGFYLCSAHNGYPCKLH